jgi:glycosyltransferase involved in cell wall biosynthesis
MRISLVGLHYAEYSCRLALALAREHDVQLILNAANVSAELEGEFETLCKHPRLEVVLLPHRRSPLLFLKNAVSLVAEIRRFKPEVVHAQEVTKDYFMLALPFLRVRYPLLITVHDPEPHSGDDSRLAKWTRHRFYIRMLRDVADYAITHGRLLSDQLVADTPRLAGRVGIVPHGPLGPLQVSGREPEAGALLFFGRINAYKGLRYFVDATLRLRAQGIQVKGIIAGRGEDLAPNRVLIEANDCFELHEEFVSRARLHDFFERAQLVVLPYTDATQSGVAAMAMGFGRPVVATRVGSIPEMVRDGETGVLVPPRDAAALADAVGALLTDPVRYARLTASIAAACSTELGWDSIARATTAVYLETIAYRVANGKGQGDRPNSVQRSADGS